MSSESQVKLDLVVSPGAFYRNADFVILVPFEGPVIQGGKAFYGVHRVLEALFGGIRKWNHWFGTAHS